MAITQVRVKIGEEWIPLAYNETTGRWEGEHTFQQTSVHQPGGYYSLTVEAANSTGQTDTLTGEQYAGLRLVVRETAAPTLTIVSPAPGYLTTGTPVFVLDAVDEEGGSGVDPESFSPEGAAAAAIPGGYRFTWTPPEGWTDGPHTVTFSVSDYDGNETAVSGAYLVDTVPPALTITAPDLHRVVDRDSVTVSGYVRDDMSGVAEIKVNGEVVWPPAGGEQSSVTGFARATSFQKEAKAAAAGTGEFSSVVPLAVGVNEIPVAVTDSAGNVTTQTVWLLRLVTDRTQADVGAVTALAGRSWDSFSEEEKAFWMGALEDPDFWCITRGAYNSQDMNRVGIAVAYISQLMSQAGYAPGTAPKTDWDESDGPTPEQRQTYLDNVAKLQALVPVPEPRVPPDMEGFRFQEANDLEEILVKVDRIFPLLERSAIYSGEGFCGEF